MITSTKLAIIGSTLFMIGYIGMYITGYYNSESNMSFNIFDKPYFSVSAAMHFGNKKIGIPFILFGTILVTSSMFLYGYETKQTIYRQALFNSIFILIPVMVLIAIMFVHFIYGCNCDMAEIPSCCYEKIEDGKQVGDVTDVGQCTYDKVKDEFATDILGDPVCCNEPSCTVVKNEDMALQHKNLTIISLVFAVLFLAINVINFKTKKVHKNILIILLIVIASTVFMAWDTGGHKYRLLFGIVEGAQTPLLLTSAVLTTTYK